MKNECIACETVSYRSAIFGRWLINENYNDGATLARLLGARGFCSPHFRKLLEADATAAGYVAHIVLQSMSNAMRSQRMSKSGYHDALQPHEPCPWCAIERDALEAALAEAASQPAPALCPPHARNLIEWKEHAVVIPQSPQSPCLSLSSPNATSPDNQRTSWWSPEIITLWGQMRTTCASCERSHIAGERRLQFLQAGPSHSEHWDIPTLCVAHDAALGHPRSAAFLKEWYETTACTVCTIEHRAQDRTGQLALTAFADDAFRESYARCQGLCIRHYAAILERCTDASLRTAILDTVQTRIDTLVWELEEASTLAAWAFRDQRSGDTDETLPHRACWFIAGGVLRPFERPSQDTATAKEKSSTRGWSFPKLPEFG